VQFCAFDVLAIDGENVRDLLLSMRKVNLERLLRGLPDGIFINPFEIFFRRATMLSWKSAR
jgi:bifunctional non-homologous end joining protein LigD